MIKTIVKITYSLEVETEKYDEEQILLLADNSVPFGVNTIGASDKGCYGYEFKKLHSLEVVKP